MKATILVIDDEQQFIDGLRTVLQGEGYAVEGYSDPQQALERWAQGNIDLVITDLKMPQFDGLDVVERVVQDDPTVPVLVLTAFATVDSAVRAMRAGAFHYVTKPFNIDEMLATVGKALAHRRLKRENLTLHRQIEERFAFANIIGGAPAMRKLFDAIRQVAAAAATVLVTGESGTGKELVARALHFTGPLKDRPFIVVNCAAIPPALLESEIFGHERGAFTGAVRQHQGKFEQAEGGTLFLDEIGELPPDVQAKFLRVLEGHDYTRVGGTRALRASCRVVAATNKKLAAEAAAGRFRADLFYRLNVITLDVPPLRERREDIPLLLHHFLQQNALRLERTSALSAEAEALLCAHDWPGNVRELQNLVERLCVLDARGEILPDDLPEALRRPAGGVVPSTGRLKERVEEYEKDLILAALAAHGGNQNGAANSLGISRQNLYYKLRKLGLAGGDAGEAEGVD